MSRKNGISEGIRLAATIAAAVNPSSPVVMGGDPVVCIKKAAELGYDAVELHWPDPALIDLDLISKACESADMTISAFATGRAYVQDGLSLIHDDSSIRTAALDRLISYVDAAAKFGASVIIGCMRGNLPGGADPAPYLERLASASKFAADHAAKQGVQIVFEAINRYENNYLNTAEETAAFIRNYNLQNTRILLDTFHMNIEDANMAEAILSCNDLVGYMHIADSNRHFPGAGHMDLSKIASALKTIKYSGFLSAECLPLPNSDAALRGWISGIKAAFR